MKMGGSRKITLVSANTRAWEITKKSVNQSLSLVWYEGKLKETNSKQNNDNNTGSSLRDESGGHLPLRQINCVPSRTHSPSAQPVVRQSVTVLSFVP